MTKEKQFPKFLNLFFMATVPDGQVQASSWIHLPALRPPPPLPNPCNDLPTPIGENLLINKTFKYRETIQPK